MENQNNKSLRSNEEIRLHVLQRDNQSCQWPGCKNTGKMDVLFIVETEKRQNQEKPIYSNGVTLCQKHMEIVNLHDKAFGPLIYDLIQLVEFENDLQATENMFKPILK
jgi:catabolite regulation protein CreA